MDMNPTMLRKVSTAFVHILAGTSAHNSNAYILVYRQLNYDLPTVKEIFQVLEADGFTMASVDDLMDLIDDIREGMELNE